MIEWRDGDAGVRKRDVDVEEECDGGVEEEEEECEGGVEERQVLKLRCWVVSSSWRQGV